MIRIGQVLAPPLFYPSLDHALYGRYETETRQANTRLPLCEKGDVSAFATKMRRAPVTRVIKDASDQRTSLFYHKSGRVSDLK
jgi:hypothetical protein